MKFTEIKTTLNTVDVLPSTSICSLNLLYQEIHNDKSLFWLKLDILGENKIIQ